MNQLKKEGILSVSPIQYAKKGLAEFIAPKKVLTVAMGGGEPNHAAINDEPEGYRLPCFRSARDKREPTTEELKLRVELTYLYEYADVLKEHIKGLKKRAWNLKP